MSKLIVVDPGHIGYDVGNVNNGRKEVEYTVPVARFFADSLKRCGFRVYLTREEGRSYSFPSLNAELAQRYTFANQLGADLFVSWHNDSSSSPDVAGVTVYVYPSVVEKESGKIAKKVVDAIASATGQVNRGVRGGDFAVLRETDMNAMLIEGGFNTNPAESERMSHDEFRKAQAEAACKAICEYYGVPYVSEKPKICYYVTGGFGDGSAQAQEFEAFMKSKGWYFEKKFQ